MKRACNEIGVDISLKSFCHRAGIPKETKQNEICFTNKLSPPLRKDDEDGHYVFEIGENLGSRYKIMGKMGEGTYGQVLECWDRKTKNFVALKIIRNLEKYRIAAMNELEVLNTIKRNDPLGAHHCIVFREWFNYRGHVCMTFDKLGRNLFECLQARKYKPLSLATTQSISRQLLKAVSFLHDCLGLVHTDLKPENILLVESDLNRTSTPSAKTSHERLNNSRSTSSKPCSSSTVSTYPRIKLIDFGSATFADQFHSFLVSTRHYRAPEVILHLGWSFPCDIWSVGCIIFELLTGSSLFQTHDDLEHLAMIERVVGPIPQRMASRACGLKRGDTKRRAESRVEKRKRRRRGYQSVDAKQQREGDQRKEGNNTREEINRQHGSLKKDHPYDDPYDNGHDDEWDDAGEESEDKHKGKSERSFSDEDDSDEDFPAATFFKESKGAEQPSTEAKAAAVCIRSVGQGVRQSQSTEDELNRRSVGRERKRRRYESPDSSPRTLKETSSPALALRWPTETTTEASLKAVTRLSPLFLELGKKCRSDLVDLSTAVDFLSRLLELNPNRRITALAALRHPFLTEKLDPIRRGEEGGWRMERNESSWQRKEIRGRGHRAVNGWGAARRDEQINDLDKRDRRFDEKQRHFDGRDRGFDGKGGSCDEHSQHFDDRRRKSCEKSSSERHRSVQQWRWERRGGCGGRTAQEEGR